MIKRQHLQKIATLPQYGIVIFVLLYVISTQYYPGGSQYDMNAAGFSWMHNYLCDLTNDKAGNGLVNTARPFAIAAVIVLCVSLAILFLLFASEIATSIFLSRIIALNGIISMLFSCLIFTDLHDTMIFQASFFGLFALVGILVTLFQSKLEWFKLGAALCVLLLVANNYVYYSKAFLYYLPVLQKIGIASILIWVFSMNRIIVKRLSIS